MPFSICTAWSCRSFKHALAAWLQAPSSTRSGSRSFRMVPPKPRLMARLVLLPHESHGYLAYESIMHTLYEQDQWIERWAPTTRANLYEHEVGPT